MSTYPFWLLSFELRDDVEAHVLEVLSAVGRGRAPDPADLERLPPVPRSYLQQPEQMQSDQGRTLAGTPVRLAEGSRPGALTLTIEFAQHDDEFAGGGWAFWLWVLDLARRPSPGEGRSVLGLHGSRRGDADSRVVSIDAEGITEDGQLITFADIDAGLRGLRDEGSGA